MASKNQVRLEAVAEVQKARAEILKLVETVNKLTEALGKTADKKFQITTGESIAKLDALEAGLVALGNASETTSEKVKKSSAKGAESVEQAAIRQTKAIQKAFDAIEKELAATEKAVSAKEKAQARLDRSATQKERNAQRSIDADKKALASVLASVDKELASEDRKVQRLIAAITRKEAARDREKNRQALRIAQKIDDDKKAVASEDAAAARVVAAERRKAEAFLQSQAASSRHMGQLLKSSEAQDKFSISAQSAARSIQAFFASIIIGKLKELLIEITETGAAFEQYSNLLSVATGSNAAAGETFQSLRGFADTFGLSLEQLVERFPRFAIAAKDSGLELEEVRTVFDAFAIANRAVGNSTEQTQRVFVALEQIFNKGVVQAEELKQQLGDSLPAAYNAMAKAIGVTTKELVVLLKENKVLANEALPALAAELLKTLGPGVLKNVTSVRAEIERMKNAIFLAKVEIAEGAKPELLEMLRVIKDIGENGALSFGQIGEAVGSLYTGISRILTLLNNIASFNLEGLGAQIIQLFSLVTQGVGEVILGINILLTKIPGIPESMRKGAEEAMRAWNQAHEDIRAGFDDVANSGVNSAAAIGDAVNIQGRNAIDALRKAQQEALAIAERQKAAAAQKEEAITKKEQEEIDKRLEAARKAIEERIKIQEKLVASIEGDTAAQAESTAQLLLAIETVEQHGEVTEQESAKIQAAVQKELDLYAEYGQAPPAALQVLADKYDVLTTAQEKAIDAQKKRLKELQEEIKKTGDELAALEAKLAGPDRDIFGNALDDAGQSIARPPEGAEGPIKISHGRPSTTSRRSTSSMPRSGRSGASRAAPSSGRSTTRPSTISTSWRS
jgi:tape measure domain-containing protein